MSWRKNGEHHCCTNRIREKKMKQKNEDSLRDSWDSIKYTNICIIVVPEGKESP